MIVGKYISGDISNMILINAEGRVDEIWSEILTHAA